MQQTRYILLSTVNLFFSLFAPVPPYLFPLSLLHHFSLLGPNPCCVYENGLILVRNLPYITKVGACSCKSHDQYMGMGHNEDGRAGES